VAEIIFGSADVRRKLKGFLWSQSGIVYNLTKIELSERAENLKIILGSCCQTATAIALLSESPDYFLGECIVLARAFLEKIINFCYLQVCDQEDYDKYISYTVQKSYRKLDRSVTIGEMKLGIKFIGEIDIDSNPLLKKGLEDFTTEKGREKTRWTNKNIEDRIKIICERSKIKPGCLIISLLSIYEDASEALHGTLYGCGFPTGVFIPSFDKENPSELKKYIEKQTALLLWELGIMFHQAILLLGEKNSIEDLIKKSTNNYERSFELMEKALKREDELK